MVSVAELLDDPAIKAYIRRMIGDEGIEVLRRFPGDGEHSDEELAEITGISLNTVRHTLYTLYEKRLAEITAAEEHRDRLANLPLASPAGPHLRCDRGRSP